MIASHTIEGKNYYFTALLKAFPDADSLVRANPELNRMAQEKQQRLEKATETHERIAAMKFSEQEIEKAGNVLAALYKPENVLGKIISEHFGNIRNPSFAFQMTLILYSKNFGLSVF